MASVRQKRITVAEWESHKATIHRLYVTEKKPFTASNGLIDIMSKDYLFFARSVDIILCAFFQGYVH
jgi:hypothetical protein